MTVVCLRYSDCTAHAERAHGPAGSISGLLMHDCTAHLLPGVLTESKAQMAEAACSSGASVANNCRESQLPTHLLTSALMLHDIPVHAPYQGAQAAKGRRDGVELYLCTNMCTSSDVASELTQAMTSLHPALFAIKTIIPVGDAALLVMYQC